MVVQIGDGHINMIPPLLCDLINYVPYFDVELVEKKTAGPVSPLVQLSYVLPPSALNFCQRNLVINY